MKIEETQQKEEEDEGDKFCRASDTSDVQRESDPVLPNQYQTTLNLNEDNDSVIHEGKIGNPMMTMGSEYLMGTFGFGA